MKENVPKQNLQEVINQSRLHHEHKFHLKHIHHKWWFWVGFILILGAIIYYVVSVDFAFAPHRSSKQPMESIIAN
jgi:hypothetical protein